MKKTLLVIATLIFSSGLPFCPSLKTQSIRRNATICLAPRLGNETAKLTDQYLFSLYKGTTPNLQVHKEHVMRVTEFTDLLAKKLNIPQNKAAALHKAAVLHDIAQRNEDIDFSTKVTEFVKQHNVQGIYTRQGLFTRQQLLNDLKLVSRNMKTAGFVEHFAGQTYRQYNDDGTSTVKNITPKNAMKTYMQLELNVDQFAPVTSLETARELGIKLTPLEQALIRFHHTTRLNITLENLKLAFPELSNPELTQLHRDLHHLLPVLVCADMLEASSNAFRGRMLYNRQKETLDDLFSYLDKALAIGNLTPQVYNACIKMLKTNNPEFKAIILKARQEHEYHLRDFVTIVALKYVPEHLPEYTIHPLEMEISA